MSTTKNSESQSKPNKEVKILPLKEDELLKADPGEIRVYRVDEDGHIVDDLQGEKNENV